MARILYVVHRFWPYPGGSERYFFALARKSVASGFEATVLTTDAWDYEHLYRPGRARIERARETIDGVRVERFRVRHPPGLRRFRQALARVSERFVPLTVQPFVPELDLRCVAMRQRFDLVHAGVFPFTSLIAAGARYARRHRAPLVCQPMLNVPDLRAAVPSPLYLSAHGRSLIARASAVVANTRLEADALARLGVAADRITVASPAIEPREVGGGDGERFRRKHGWNGAILLQVSTQTFDKGSLHGVEALRVLREAGRDVRLVLVGPPLSDLTDHLARLTPAIRERVHVLGQIAEEEKKDALAAADVLVMPSRTDSFGIAFLEAWHYAKPVIGCHAGGVPEVIEDGVDGFLVPFGDAHMLAEYAAKLIDEPELASAMGARGRAKVEERYTWDRTYPIVEVLYRRLLNRAPSHPL